MKLAAGLTTYSDEPPADWRYLLDRARLFDAAGIDRLAISDHVVFGERLEEYGRPELGGMAGGSQPTGSDGQYLDPLTLLAAIAGLTQRIRLQTNVLLAALRRPVTLAKSASTIDVLSHGRFDLGVGIGWQREEYEAAGLDFSRRGRLLDHSLEVCQVLWSQRRASYSSPELSFENIHMAPTPTAPTGVPVWCGGRATEKVARRIARFGVGWITWDLPQDSAAQRIRQMRGWVSAAGGDGGRMRVQAGLPIVRGSDGAMNVKATMAQIPALADAGITDVILNRLHVPDYPAEAQDSLAAVVQEFRAVVGGD